MRLVQLKNMLEKAETTYVSICNQAIIQTVNNKWKRIKLFLEM